MPLFGTREVDEMATAQIDPGTPNQGPGAGPRSFASVRRGYDPQDVRAFERAAAEELARVRGELEWERARREALERRIRAAEETAYARISRDFGEMLRGADAEVARIRTLSAEQAHALVTSAQGEADRMVAAAQEAAEQVLIGAREQATSLMAASKQRADALRTEAESVKREAERALAAAQSVREEADVMRTEAQAVWADTLVVQAETDAMKSAVELQRRQTEDMARMAAEREQRRVADAAAASARDQDLTFEVPALDLPDISYFLS
jgi:fused signal recognition particle receptor